MTYLSNDVFDQETVTMIEHVTVICALKSLISKIKDRGVVATGFEDAGKFVTAARAITDTIDAIESEDLKKVYRDFVSIY